MTDASEWTGRVGNAWAEEWRRTDRSFGALTDRLLDPAAVGGFAHVLDVGCGAGELVERLATANASEDVLGIDISADLLAIARQRCTGLPNVDFAQADAAIWRAEREAQPDLVISRHGVMFFADPVAAFANLREQSVPGACLRFSCFRARTDNAWAVALASILPPQPPADPGAPGPFAFADPACVEAILAAAGWEDIEFERVDYAMIAGEGDRAIEDALAYFQRIGPAARAMAEMTPGDREVARERLRALLAEHYVDECVSLASAAWVVAARAASGRRL